MHASIDQARGKRPDNRKEFQAMLTDASRGQFGVVLVWALDRFSREGVMKTFGHIRKLQENGVAFESYTEEHFRTTGNSGELMIALAAWIAEQQRERLVEQTKAGLARARAQGKQLGRRPKILPRDKIRQLHEQGLVLPRS
jgi:DNA invertase Pin-like site-specific DNA recombinase